MHILDALKKETINVDLKSNNKKGVIEELVTPVAQLAGVAPEELIQVLLERESLGSTGIGGGVGIPHGKLKALDSLILGFGLSRKGVDFESMDGRPTFIFFLLLTPENATDLHLKLLARISRLLKDEGFKKRLKQADTSEEILTIIREEDQDF